MTIIGRFLASFFLCAMFCVSMVCSVSGQDEVSVDAGQTSQTMCPVMVDQEIDPNIFTEYKGKKVYFCCVMCKGIFEKDPETYLARLPQFAVEDVSFLGATLKTRLAGVIKPLGIATLVMLIITFLLGWQVKRNRKVYLRIHLAFATLTVLVALSHATLVFLLF